MFEEQEMPYAAKAFMELHPQPVTPKKVHFHVLEGRLRQQIWLLHAQLQPFPGLAEQHKGNK